MKTLYFAYGSNLNEGGMDFRCPDAVKVGRASLDGWRLTFRMVADIEPSAGDVVEGGLWEVSRLDLIALDRYEGAPHLYQRRMVDVTDEGGRRRKALTYVMTAKHGLGLPSPSYYRSIDAGFRDFGIPDDTLVAALERTLGENAEAGVLKYVPEGAKRLRAVLPEPEVEVEVETMSPATRRLWALEAGGEECLAAN